MTISQVESPSQILSVQELLREYTTWALTLSAESKGAPTFHGLEEELAGLPGVYAPPAGRLLLAIHDGLPAGCIALKPHDPATAELKRVYVRPSFRGLKIGQQLIASAVGAAREVSYRRLILDSHASMTKAHALYEEAGFRRVGAPADFPEALKPIVVFMEMDLEPEDAGRSGD